MKKQYISPKTTIVMTDVESHIVTASTTIFSDFVDESQAIEDSDYNIFMQ